MHNVTGYEVRVRVHKNLALVYILVRLIER